MVLFAVDNKKTGVAPLAGSVDRNCFGALESVLKPNTCVQNANVVN